MDITDLTKVSDSIQFIQQTNFYSFTAPFDGTYRFEFSGISDAASFTMALNEGGEDGFTFVDSDFHMGNGDGITTQFTAGTTYRLIMQWSIDTDEQNRIIAHQGNSGYTLNIGTQKAIVGLPAISSTADSIQFTAPEDGTYYFVLDDVPEGGSQQQRLGNPVGKLRHDLQR